MKSQMNQIIIEGKITGEAENKGGMNYVPIETVHAYKDKDGKRRGEKFSLTVELDATMSGRLLSKCKEGQTIRVIGYLKTTESGLVVIAAEHIEFKTEEK